LPVNVSDFRANRNENIRHAADAIGRSQDRRAVFEAIYHGKKAVKTVPDLMATTGLSHKRVLTEGKKLVLSQLVEQDKVDRRVAYKKDPTISHYKKQILGLVDQPQKKDRYPTKQEPRVSGPVVTYRIAVPGSYPQPQEITVDDIESFAAVKGVVPGTVDLTKVLESHIKEFLMRVIGETVEYDYTDWGGEKNDLYTTRLRLRGARRTAAFAIKGRATRGKLTPKKMGTNGDQVLRLLASEAAAFFVVYHSQVDQSIHEQMRASSLSRAVAGNRVYYGVIDGRDLSRLVAAYAEEFEAAGST
jgi:ABC-type molybdate transport system substrate-binding protein